MGVDLILLCHTCKVYHYTGDRYFFTQEGAKWFSGKAGVVKIGRLVSTIAHFDKFSERLRKKGFVKESLWTEDKYAKQRLQRVLDFYLRHRGHSVVVTSKAGDTWWDYDDGWRSEDVK